MDHEQGGRPHGEQQPVVVAPGGGSTGRTLASLAGLAIVLAGAAVVMTRAPSSPAAAEAVPAQVAEVPPAPPTTNGAPEAPPAVGPVAPAATAVAPAPDALRARMQALLPAGMQVDRVRVSGEVVFAAGRAPRNAVVSDGLRALDAAAMAHAPDAPRVELLSVRMDANGVDYEVRVPVAALAAP